LSHFTSVKVEMSNIESLKEALGAIAGVVEVKTDATVRGYQGNTMTSQVVAVMDGKYDIGFDLEGNEVKITADWWGLNYSGGTNTTEEQFVNQVKQQYTKVEASNRLSLEGFTLEESVNEEGTIILTATRWV